MQLKIIVSVMFRLNPAKPDTPGGAFIETEIWRKFVPQTTEEDTIGVLIVFLR